MTPQLGVVRDRWNVYQVTYDDRFGIVSFDAEAAEHTAAVGYPHERRLLLTLPAGQASVSGLPSEAGSAQLAAFEDALVAALDAAEVRGWLVGRLTTGGRRILVFQLDEPDRFDHIAATIVPRFSDLRPRVAKARGWAFFDENIRPQLADRMQIASRGVIEGLRASGSDLAQPHVLDHTFVGRRTGLAEIERRLTGDGFRPTRRGGDFVVLSKPSRLDLLAVTDVAFDLHELAERAGVRYQGWGAAPVRPR